MKYCPFCKKHINPNAPHIYHCKENKETLDRREIKFKYISYNFPKITKELLIELYVEDNLSLPDIKKCYGIDFKSILFLLEHYNIQKRTQTESANTIAQIKIKKTCLKKYGTTNVLSKGTIIYNKKQQSIIDRYGVDNPFKSEEINKLFQNNDDFWLTKYGLTSKEFRSKERKRSWDNKTDEQKNEWLEKSIYTNRNNKEKGVHTSSLETRVSKILLDSNITYTTQFKIKTKSYDFLLNDIKTILEVNGDYWHCNPSIYKAEDIICFPYGNITAQERWNRDAKKHQLAIDNGYKIVYIWESEIKETKTDESLKQLIIEKIKHEA
jgi:G:T-mismatch repair DNA endonuclease (very short patch repair protein)/ribosomal protein S8E